MAENPRKRFNIPHTGFTVFDLEREFKVCPEEFLSMGKATPFDGMKFYGKCLLTAHNGKLVYKN